MDGDLGKDSGVILDNNSYIVVKKKGVTGDKIPSHNHPEANVLFTLVKGKIEITLNNKEKHLLEAGQVLSFDGNNYISAEFLEAGEAVITLVKKQS